MKISQNYLKHPEIKKENYDFKEGSIITGTISNIDNDNVTIKTNKGYILKFDKSEVTGNKGDEIEFIVLKNQKNSISLKQNNTRQTTQYKQNNLQEEVTYNNYNEINLTSVNSSGTKSKSYIKTINNKTNTFESDLSIKKAKESLNHISNTLSKMALKSLNKMGINPEKIEIEQASQIMKDNIAGDTSEGEDLEDDNIELDIKKMGISEADYYKYASLLTKFNMPITEQNILTLQNIENKIGEINNLSQGSILNLVKQQESITFNDLYISKYSNNYEQEPNNSQHQLENLEQLIINLFEEIEIQPTEENIEIAKNFISNNIEISKENVEKYKKLENIKNSIDTEYILKNAIYNIKKGENVLELNIFPTETELEQIDLMQTYLSNKEIIPKITAEDIQNLLDRDLDVTIRNIVQQYESFGNIININITEKAVSEKLNLAKIQMKMTNEALLRLADSNIDINIKPLKEVISQLENVQDTMYEKNLKIANVEPTAENLNIMKQTISNIENTSSNLKYNTFDKIINKEIDFSLNSISNEISNNINKNKIFETFELFETVPRESFGDKIDKLNTNFEKLLKNNNLEISESNLKAAKIISLNNIEFNEENLIKVKTIDSKIEHINNKLQPLIIAKLIKNGINPSTENIDDLIFKINSISKESTQTSTEKISEYILEMSKKGDINDKEKQSIIAIYKMLNLIQKNGSASIGSLLKIQGSLTLGNLLEASILYQDKKKNIVFDKSIDDSFGEIKSLTTAKGKITNDIIKGITFQEYDDILSMQIIDYSTPERVANILKDFRANDMLLEEVLDKLKEQGEDNQVFLSEESMLNVLKNVKNMDLTNKDALKWMMDNNIPATVANIENIIKSTKGALNTSKDIEELNNKLEENDISPIELLTSDLENINEKNDFYKNVESVQNKIENNFDEILNLESISDITEILLKNKMINQKLDVSKALNKIDNGIYQLPIKLSNGKLTDLNIYVLNQEALANKREVNMFLNLETKNLGNVQAYIILNDSEITLKISSNNKNGLEKLKQFSNEFKSAFEEFEICNILFGVEEPLNTYEHDFKEKTIEKIEEIKTEFNTVV